MKRKIILYIVSENYCNDNNQTFNQRILNMFNTRNLEIIKNFWFKKDKQALCILEIECVVDIILKIIVRLFKTIGILDIYYCKS
ncbi:hypothetical protein ONB78_00430 [Candidatus Karelsulcia muelleri]|uniref:hypothetical protein n=1 Tax=Candidatus Karelsulcia muelleri TaxID=336810 RepID=UPI002363F6C7|nr:hypothetical protein [Candidatus Karelsulcia muelleri]WDE42277.1 hypothetical protein ONB78_00430 [Candidatus Karelsulcia muelleri]WDR79126.1 hypothetical protein ONB77_00215 [Candidatus Karelsulcia muelleri]